MFDLESLRNYRYCNCGEIIPDNNINEYCDTCAQYFIICIKCDRYIMISDTCNALCLDCFSDEKYTDNECLKCNLCGKHSSSPLCWTCENNPLVQKQIPKIFYDAKIKVYYNTNLKYHSDLGKFRDNLVRYIKNFFTRHLLKIHKFDCGFYFECYKEDSQKYKECIDNYKNHELDKNFIPDHVEID